MIIIPTYRGRKMLHLLSDFASSAKYLEVKQQHKIEKDGQLQTDGKCI